MPMRQKKKTTKNVQYNTFSCNQNVTVVNNKHIKTN